MDAIKKKMQAMKVEKDNAMDRSDVCEQVWIVFSSKIRFKFKTIATLRPPRTPRCARARPRRRWRS